MERTTWIHLNDSFPWTVIQLTESGLDHCLPHPQSLNCRWHRCWKCEHEAFWPYQDSMTEVQTGPFKWPKINCSPGFHTVAGVLAVPLAAEAGLGQREGGRWNHVSMVLMHRTGFLTDSYGLYWKELLLLQASVPGQTCPFLSSWPEFSPLTGIHVW